MSSALFENRAPFVASKRCAHCKNSIELEVRGQGELFCCTGCRAAHALISSAGLGAYYQQLDASRGLAPRAERSYAEFDEQSFVARYVTCSADESRLVLFLEGLHCSACIWLLERLPKLSGGVSRATLDVGRGALEVAFTAG